VAPCVLIRANEISGATFRGCERRHNRDTGRLGFAAFATDERLCAPDGQSARDAEFFFAISGT
jgi:hypothetical protein